MKLRRLLATGSALVLATVFGAASASAKILWDWSFNGESGAFQTDGSAPGGVAAPGTYNFIDFSANASAVGMPLGSVSGGQYTPSGFSTTTPYSFIWNGSSVTRWNQSGTNRFHWWVFDSTSNPNLFYLFGWATGNINDPTKAAAYNSAIPCCDSPLSEGTVTVQFVQAVPEPATWAMLILGLGMIGLAARRRRAAAALAR